MVLGLVHVSLLRLFSRLWLVIHETTVDMSSTFASFISNMVTSNLYVIYININVEAFREGPTSPAFTDFIYFLILGHTNRVKNVTQIVSPNNKYTHI